jgi:dTDP-4-dehydrorhamnose reductase
MIVILGASGYIGQVFEAELKRRKMRFISVSRKDLDYTQPDKLLAYLKKKKPDFLINAAGFVGKPNVDACETARAETLLGNVILPQTIAHVCTILGLPWGHLSTGCIYNGAKIGDGKKTYIEKDLSSPSFKKVLAGKPWSIRGFDETDEPNFSFRNPPCSFYSGSKALAEEVLSKSGNVYIWRLRIPFDENDHARNYISKMQRYAKVYDNVNSLSHNGDSVNACLDLWEKRAPFGTYNITNPGFIMTREVIDMIKKTIAPDKTFEFWKDDNEFYATAAKTPRSNCILDVSKLLATSVKMRPVREALADSLARWKSNAVPQSAQFRRQFPARNVRT